MTELADKKKVTIKDVTFRESENLNGSWPAVNVKHYKRHVDELSGEAFLPNYILDDKEMEVFLEVAWQAHCGFFWETVVDDAISQVWGNKVFEHSPFVKFAQEGRSGGWLVVFIAYEGEEDEDGNTAWTPEFIRQWKVFENVIQLQVGVLGSTSMLKSTCEEILKQSKETEKQLELRI